MCTLRSGSFICKKSWYPDFLLHSVDFNNGKCMLNWQQGLFEGMKAYRSEDGRILLFRPEENAMRMISGADRMSMPAPDVNTFVNAVKQTVLANKRWVNFCPD